LQLFRDMRSHASRFAAYSDGSEQAETCSWFAEKCCVTSPIEEIPSLSPEEAASHLGNFKLAYPAERMTDSAQHWWRYLAQDDFKDVWTKLQGNVKAGHPDKCGYNSSKLGRSTLCVSKDERARLCEILRSTALVCTQVDADEDFALGKKSLCEDKVSSAVLLAHQSPEEYKEALKLSGCDADVFNRDLLASGILDHPMAFAHTIYRDFAYQGNVRE
jgi:hypothetical protein